MKVKTLRATIELRIKGNKEFSEEEKREYLEKVSKDNSPEMSLPFIYNPCGKFFVGSLSVVDTYIKLLKLKKELDL